MILKAAGAPMQRHAKPGPARPGPAATHRQKTATQPRLTSKSPVADDHRMVIMGQVSASRMNVVAGACNIFGVFPDRRTYISSLTLEVSTWCRPVSRARSITASMGVPLHVKISYTRRVIKVKVNPPVAEIPPRRRTRLEHLVLSRRCRGTCSHEGLRLRGLLSFPMWYSLRLMLWRDRPLCRPQLAR